MPFNGAFQTTWLGWTIRLVSGNRLLKYSDEIHFPEQYTNEATAGREREQQERHRRNGASLHDTGEGDRDGVNEVGRPMSGKQMPGGGWHPQNVDAEPASNMGGMRREREREKVRGSSATLSTMVNTWANGRCEAINDAQGETLPRISTSQETVMEQRERQKSTTSPAGPHMETTEARVSTRVADDQRTALSAEDAEKGPNPSLVTWYGPDDPENPYNWSTWYKSVVALQMALLTFAVYVGSSIYSSGISGLNSVTVEFDVSTTSALVGLTLFVIGYGIGPMIWAPLSEFPNIGRLPIYLATTFVFVALQFPTIYANNLHTLLACFLAGFFGSPALAVGGATMGDMFKPKHLAYAIGVWGCGGGCGPVLGPVIGGFSFMHKNWQWPLWVLTWLSGGCLVFLAIFFPETSGKNILHRRMVRLRKITGNPDLKTQAELDAAGMTGATVAKMILWRPVVLFFEPILLVFNVYLALIYGLLYIWFESFPLVFQEIHGFNPGESGLSFMGIFVGAWLSCGVFCIYIHKYLGPLFDKNDGIIPCPEIRLLPAPIAAVCIPIAMFGFGWTGQYPWIHWIVPIIFTAFFGVGLFILFQCIFAYFGDTYYTEMGSVLTLNDLFRSSFGAAFPLFANAMFARLGINWGSSLLGFIACAFIPAPFCFIKYGKHIRETSKYAVHGMGWDKARLFKT